MVISGRFIHVINGLIFAISTIYSFPDRNPTKRPKRKRNCCTEQEAKCDACNAGLSIKKFCATIPSTNSKYNHTGCEGWDFLLNAFCSLSGSSIYNNICSIPTNHLFRQY